MAEDTPAAIEWRCRPMGDSALLVEGEPALPLTNRVALALAAALDEAAPPGLRAVVPAMASVLIAFDPLLLEHSRLEARVHALLADLEPAPEVAARVVEIPVVYGGEAGPDLEEVARRVGLTPREVVAAHVAQTHRVLMIGFAPGFPYIGGLPRALVLPRRATPRAAVPPGSVAIAGEWTGIYPARLPGGWHLIGRTALRLFDPSATPPATLAPGDGVRFVPLPEGITP